MSSFYRAERFMRVATSLGETFEIGPDPDTGSMVQIRYLDENGKPNPHHQIVMPVAVWALIKKYELEKPEDLNVDVP